MSDPQYLMAQGRDPVFFAESILGIKLNHGQKRWFRLLALMPNGWEWAYKYMAHVAGNQVGKTVGLAIIILWACNYKIGTPFGSTDEALKAYMSSPYNWFHLAPRQDQAYRVLDDIRLITRGAHPVQDKGKEFGLSFSLPSGLVWEDKVATYYNGLYFASGAVCQFRTTEDGARAILGYRANGISFDEAAFERNLKTIINEVLMMRLISTGGPLIMVSTPNGIDDFFEVVMDIRNSAMANVEDEETIWFTGDQRGMLISTVADNVGFGYTQEEVDRMEAALDEGTKEQQLRGAFLEPAEAFFRPSDRILHAFNPRLPLEMSPRPGHKYVIFWDPSLSSDPTACIVIDVTKKPWIGVKMIHQKKPVGIDRLLIDIWNLHITFNGARDNYGRMSSAHTFYDGTAMGGVAIRQSLRGLRPSTAVNFGGNASKKRNAFVQLRTVLLDGTLVLPDWLPVKREVLNYRLEDTGIQQDLAFALAGAASEAEKFGGTVQAPFSPHATIAVNPWRRT